MTLVLKDLHWLKDSSSSLSITSLNYCCSIQVFKSVPLFIIRVHEQTIYQFASLASEQVYFLWFLHSTEIDISLDIFKQQRLPLLAVWQSSY